jgi:hypothetical protein
MAALLIGIGPCDNISYIASNIYFRKDRWSAANEGLTFVTSQVDMYQTSSNAQPLTYDPLSKSKRYGV